MKQSKNSPDLTEEDRERLRARTVVASVSGGKDSAALSLWLTEQGIEHLRVFADTGWEHPGTYVYLREVLPRFLGPIEWVTGPRLMVDLIRHKRMFPSRLKRYCTEHLKVFPIRDRLNGLDEDPINAVGIRAAESKARARLDRWEWSKGFDCWVWRPLIQWAEEDVIATHRRHGLPPNPLYLDGAERVGCWPCIFARKAEIRHLADTDPERIETIAGLERELTERAGAPRSFFHTHERRGVPKPIDEIVRWSRTRSRGRDYLLDPHDGCMRWGLCE